MLYPALYINPLPHIPVLALLDEKSVALIPYDKADFRDDFPRFFTHLFEQYTPKSLWCITWPGTFTRMRIVTLTLNTLRYTHPNIMLVGGHFFDLIPMDSVPLLQINTSEYLTQMGGEIVTVRAESLWEKKYTGYLEKNTLTEWKNFVEYSEDWGKVRTYFSKKSGEPLLAPIYIKSPHITCPTR